jgi:serine/threonine protein kinase
MTCDPLPERVGKYTLLDQIGSGAFSRVYKARHDLTLLLVAIKVISKEQVQTVHQFEILQREVNLMKVLDHPFIAPLYDIMDDDQNFYLVMELVEKGTLLQQISESKGLGETVSRRIFFQIVSTLDYLHGDMLIAHRDLKADNVLLDERMNIRLIDFGLSRVFSPLNPLLETACGSPQYVAPEIIQKEPYTVATDVWASGVLLYAMVFGILPFQGDNVTAVLQAIVNDDPPIPKQVSPELRGLLGRLLMKDPDSRIPVCRILEHPWLADMKPFTEEELEKMRILTPQMDEVVVSELRAIGCEIGGLYRELQSHSFTERAAMYRMLRRRRIHDEMPATILRKRKLSLPTPPPIGSARRLPMLTGSESGEKTPGGAQRSSSPAFRKMRPVAQIRSRAATRSADLPVAKFRFRI